MQLSLDTELNEVDTATISAQLGLTFQPYTGPQAAHTKLAYTAEGPRGAQYGLVRYPKLPHVMFVMNLNTWNMHASIHGNRYFTDATGALTTYNG